MDKRVVAAIGMLLLGYLIKVFLDNLSKITNCVCSFVFANPVVIYFIIGGLVLIIAFAVLYGLLKMFLKWQDPDSDKSESCRKG